MGRVTTIITGDASQLTAEQRKVAEAAKKMSDEFTQVDRSIRQMGREADKVFRETRTGQEKHNQELERLSTLLKHGKIDQDTYRRAVEQVNDEYRDSKSTLGDLRTAMIGFLGVAGGLSIVREMWQSIREDATAVAELEKAQFPSSGQLMQVASDLADFQQLKAQSAELLRSGAATSMAEAQQIMFALRSTGLERERDVFADVARTQLVPNLTDLINSVDSLTDAFGRPEAGDARQVISKALAVSGLSQRPAQEIVSSTARVGATAFARGLTDEETLAAVGVLADPFSSPERAAERLQAFLNATQRKGIEGRGLQGLLTAAEDRIAAEGKAAIETLGDATAVAFFEAAKANRDQILAATQAAEAANLSDSLSQKVRDLEFAEAANIQRRRQAGRLEERQVRGARGEDELIRQSILDAAERLDEATGAAGGFFGALSKYARSTMSFFRMDPIAEASVPGLIREAEAAGQTEVVEILREIRDLQQQRNELDRQENVAPRRAPPTSPRTPRPETN